MPPFCLKLLTNNYKMNKRNLLTVLCGLVLITFGVFMWVSLQVKTGYVDQVKLFGEFKMKKVLEAEFQKVENMRKHQLDSMALLVSVMEKQASTRTEQQYVFEKKQELEYKSREFAEMNEALKAQFNEQIWNQLNQYVKDYSEKGGYDYVLGGTGDGAVMFASDKHDVTTKLIEYVNQRFDGEKK
jgi:outer membrane protein